MSNITRRQFIQGVAAGVAGIGVSSLFPSPTPEAEALSPSDVERMSGFSYPI